MEYTNTGYTNQDNFDIQLKNLEKEKREEESGVFKNFRNELSTALQSIEKELERKKIDKIERKLQRRVRKGKYKKLFNKIEKMGEEESTRNLPCIKTALLVMVRSSSSLVIKNFKKYEKHNFAKEILKEACTSASKQAIENFTAYEHIGKEAIRILTNACKDSPTDAVINFFQYEQIGELAKSIFKKALNDPNVNIPARIIGQYDEYFPGEDINVVIKTMMFKHQIGNYLDQNVDEKKVGEILSKPHLIISLSTYLQTHSLTIGNQNINIKDNINFQFGILKNYFNNIKKYSQIPGKEIPRNKVLADYEEKIAEFINQGKIWSKSNKDNITSFIMRATNKTRTRVNNNGKKEKIKGTDGNGSIKYSNQEIQKIYEQISSKTILFNKEDIESPEEVLKTFKTHIQNDTKNNTNKYYLFHIAGHGSTYGNMAMAGGNRKKSHFNQLFNLQAEYPERIKIDISSCHSGYKDDDFHNNTIENLSLSSGKHHSYGGKKGSDEIFIQAFKKKNKDGKFEADFDGDGEVNFNEALLYRAIHYQQSLTPIMFENEQGEVIDIVQTIPATQNNLSKDVARIA